MGGQQLSCGGPSSSSLRDACSRRMPAANNDVDDPAEGGGVLPTPGPAGGPGPAGLLQLQHDDLENQPQQQACWERFLLKKTLNVLLVESDDSTRQVVSALLRCCMYQVISAENGQQAWTYLEDMRSNIDLVLTEVFMPGISGISLLSRIMSHNICKNIPVIMMSSNDDMRTVFKCLSKGAVDFLVKPIRKNELKNLWQHVWRRCHSTQKCAKSKGGNESGNNSGSNDDEAGIGLNARDDSDNGSGTQVQSSWTKRAVEIDSPQAMSLDQLADSPDSTCAQVIHPKSEIIFSNSNRWRLPLPDSSNRNSKKQKDTDNDDFMGKDLEIGGPGNLYMDRSPNERERPTKAADHQNNSKESMMMENLEEPTIRAADLIGSMAKNMDTQQAARVVADTPNFSSSSKVPEAGKEKNKQHVLPSLELSLKRSRSCGDGANNSAAKDEEQRNNVLRRSNLSAFTRYHTFAAASNQQGGTGLVGSCSPHDNSSEAVKTDSTYNMKSNNSDAAPIKQGSNGSSNNNDMGSTTKDVVTKPATNSKERATTLLPSSAAAASNGQYTSAFHPVHWTAAGNNSSNNNYKAAKQQQAAGDQVANNRNSSSSSHHHPSAAAAAAGGDHHLPRPTLVHYVHFDQSGGGTSGGALQLQCGSSSVFDPTLEGQATNYNNNTGAGSKSGSNDKQNGGSTAGAGAGAAAAAAAAAAGRTTTDTEIRAAAGGGGGGNGSGSGSGNDTYVRRLAATMTPRQAQLKKYREKKKDRNFGKKVRYQSRKRLADQRPRVRGQFVKQAVQNLDERDGAGER